MRSDKERLRRAGFETMVGGQAVDGKNCPAWKHADQSIIVKAAAGDWRLYLCGHWRATRWNRCHYAISHHWALAPYSGHPEES